jgi:hypothetical protein
MSNQAPVIKEMAIFDFTQGDRLRETAYKSHIHYPTFAIFRIWTWL